MKKRNPLAILREIDTIKKETRLTDAYKAHTIGALERELLEAQGQQTIEMPPQQDRPPPKGK
ncbi:MAG: hypothetical protein [Arizlama microvirus]|nr:MAG: hypothetical protein [Arizlama microvirus]